MLLNGFKSEFQENDFEIFNEGNYSVDLFTKFLRKIINELNICIKKNNYKNDFIIKHLIEIHKKNLSRYINGKLDYNDKQDLNKSDNKNFDKNSFVKIKIYQNNNYHNENKNKINNKNWQNIGNKSKESNASFKSSSLISNKSDVLPDKNITSPTNSFSEFIKDTSDYFENLINTKLIENNENDKLIAMPNIAFKFNLKIPVYDKETNYIDFKSVHLDYSNEDGESKTGNIYDFKEIDSVYKNISNNSIMVGDLNYFNINFNYIKNKKETNFTLIENKENIFNIYSDSIFCCEIKYSFPNTSRGKREFFNVKIKKQENIDNDIINSFLGGLVPYIEELDKLIRKFFFFFDIYKNKNTKKIPKNMQIVLLYDFFNVNIIDPNFKDIKEVTKKVLEFYSQKFNSFNLSNILFQLIFFDYHSLNKDREKIIKAKDNTIQEQNNKLIAKDNTIQEKNNKLIAKDNTIQEQNNKLIDKDNTIQEQKKELIAKDSTIQKQKNELIDKDNTIQLQKNELIDRDNKLLIYQKREKSLEEKMEDLLKNNKLTDEERWAALTNFLKKK